MSNLIAIAYPDQGTAEEVMGTLGRLQKEHLIELEDAVVVTRDPRARSSCTSPTSWRPAAPWAAPCGAA